MGKNALESRDKSSVKSQLIIFHLHTSSVCVCVSVSSADSKNSPRISIQWEMRIEIFCAHYGALREMDFAVLDDDDVLKTDKDERFALFRCYHHAHASPADPSTLTLDITYLSDLMDSTSFFFMLVSCTLIDD
jgi:hypothetical protein